MTLIGASMLPAPAAADVITATLDGCVSVTDSRLSDAMWSAVGTFQAVAFDDDEPGCEPTIAHPVMEAYVLDEDRMANTLGAWLNLDNLPQCGRRQYDVHLYLTGGILDPFGLKSLVIDTGVPCQPSRGITLDPPVDPRTPPEIPEPSRFALLICGVTWMTLIASLGGRRRL